MVKPIREDKIERGYIEALTIKIEKGKTSYYVTAFNESGEPVAFGVRRSLEKAFRDAFVPGFYDYLKTKFRKAFTDQD